MAHYRDDDSTVAYRCPFGTTAIFIPSDLLEAFDSLMDAVVDAAHHSESKRMTSREHKVLDWLEQKRYIKGR